MPIKNNLDNPIFKITLFSSVYMIILIFISPFIDHLFSSLETDIEKKESNSRILFEIILHVIVLSISWYFLNHYMKLLLTKIFKIHIREQTSTAIEFVNALALIGLQKNLIDKLEYISLQHPFRYHLPTI